MISSKKALLLSLVVFCGANVFANRADLARSAAQLVKLTKKVSRMEKRAKSMKPSPALDFVMRGVGEAKRRIGVGLNDLLRVGREHLVIAKDGHFAVVPDSHSHSFLSECWAESDSEGEVDVVGLTRGFDIGDFASDALEKITPLNVNGEQLSGIVSSVFGGASNLQVERINLNDILGGVQDAVTNAVDDAQDVIADAAGDVVEGVIQSAANQFADQVDDIPVVGSVIGHFITQAGDKVADDAAAHVEDFIDGSDSEDGYDEQDEIDSAADMNIFMRALRAYCPCLFRQD